MNHLEIWAAPAYSLDSGCRNRNFTLVANVELSKVIAHDLVSPRNSAVVTPRLSLALIRLQKRLEDTFRHYDEFFILVIVIDS